MFRGAAVPFAMFLVVVVVMVGVSPSLAASSLHYSPTQELIARLIVNQLEILQNLNETTSSIASHDDELNQLREDVNQTLEGMKNMNNALQTGISALSETMNNEVERLNETAESRGRAVNEMNDKIQSMDRNIKGWINATRMHDNQRVMERLEAIKNTVAAHHLQPDEDDLYVNHNDTLVSLCDGHKVLYGGDGLLAAVSTGNYSNDMDCTWTVTLPEGSRPVFRWYYFNIEQCSSCGCDYIYLRDMDHHTTDFYCGDNPPDGSYLTIMDNKFKVKFHTDGSVTGRGFKLMYRSVERN